MRHRAVIALAAAAAAVAGGLAGGLLALRDQPADGGSPPPPANARVSTSANAEPPGAVAAVRLLVSADGRAALTPELNTALPAGRLFPAGTTFVPTPGTWHQTGAYANVTGTLREPGHSAAVAEIGLVNRHGRWLVTFEAAR